MGSERQRDRADRVGPGGFPAAIRSVGIRRPPGEAGRFSPVECVDRDGIGRPPYTPRASFTDSPGKQHGDCRDSGGWLSRLIPNPLRALGLARVLAGGVFVAAGAATLRQYGDLVPQAERLLGSDGGTTGAPLRSLLMLLLAIVLVATGLVLAARGIAWIRRVRLSEEAPATIAPAEVIATLRDRRLPAFADGTTPPYWPLRRWLPDEMAALTWWRRDIASGGVRALVRSSAVAIAVAAGCVAMPRIMTDDLIGPFPTGFVLLLPFVTAIWAVLGLMLIGSGGPRVESMELPVPTGVGQRRILREGQIIESSPHRLDRESPGLALTLGATGIAVQCLMPWWWNLSPIDYPLRATSIVRHAGSIAGGIVLFAVGGRMLAAAARLLLLCRYESTLILIDGGSRARSPGPRRSAARASDWGVSAMWSQRSRDRTFRRRRSA